MAAAYFLVGVLAWAYGLIILVALCFVIAGKTWKWRLGGAGVIMIIFAPTCSDQWEHHQYKIRYNRVKALFDERCKTAGVKIYETADDVDGVLLMNVPPAPKKAIFVIRTGNMRPYPRRAATLIMCIHIYRQEQNIYMLMLSPPITT